MLWKILADFGPAFPLGGSIGRARNKSEIRQVSEGGLPTAPRDEHPDASAIITDLIGPAEVTLRSYRIDLRIFIRAKIWGTDRLRQ